MTRTPQPKHRAPTPTCRYYSEVRDLISDSDLLLFRRPPGRCSAIARLITVGGRSQYSHAAKAIWWRGEKAENDVLLCVEMREFKGGRAVTLASQVDKFPGLIDVYKSNPEDRWPEYDRERASAHMLRLAGEPYGYAAVLNAALLHVWPFCMYVNPGLNDGTLDDLPEFCSDACSESDRIGGGVDPVNNLADRFTEPGDLARSDFYQYQWTLVPDGADATQGRNSR